MSAIGHELIAGIVPALRTIILPGLACAGVAQALVAAAALRVHGPGSGARLRLARAIIRADLVAALLILLITKIAFCLNRGPYDWRGAVITTQLIATSVVAFVVYTRAMSRGLQRPSPLGGLAMTVVTFAGLTLPGVRLSDARRPAEVTRTVIRLDRLPPELDGLRIAFVSDTHVSRHISPAEMRARLQPLRGIRAHLVIFGGDLATKGDDEMRTAAELIDEAAPGGGRFAVLGNHDVWIDAREAETALTDHGFSVLRDKGCLLRIGDARIWVAGITNGYNRPGRLDKALDGAPDDAFVLLLAHSPDVLREPLYRRADLILSAHTHGGQVVLPLVGPIACSSWFGPRYASGLFELGRTKMYVTRGLGEVVTPFRVLCEPEIAVLELRSVGKRR